MATSVHAPTLPGLEEEEGGRPTTPAPTSSTTPASTPPVSTPPSKSRAAFRTISEVAQDLDVPQHVLRFWETKFNQIRPMKRGGGRRYYRPEDVALLRRIRTLLYEDGFTIKGVQKLLRDGAIKPQAMEPDAPPPPSTSEIIAAVEQKAIAEGGLSTAARAELSDIIGELSAVRDLLAAR